ncbi:hypothetical protein NE237_015518 [Protea cynaroides]|uniref:Uncharacterized protein n=1 Tax=Protea cynaroides TaxID=273540 RepID=A0A9Q0QR42_9MAGN|nr:hypothetical protein NE237_015518 [Protea cynaroides]
MHDTWQETDLTLVQDKDHNNTITTTILLQLPTASQHSKPTPPTSSPSPSSENSSIAAPLTVKSKSGTFTLLPTIPTPPTLLKKTLSPTTKTPLNQSATLTMMDFLF